MSLSVLIKEKAYGGSQNLRTVVQEVSFQAQPREIVGLFGPSGCGKSTCLRIIAGLDRQYAGEVRLDNSVVHGPIQAIGMVAQGQVAYDWLTVADNIAFGLRYAASQHTGGLGGLRRWPFSRHDTEPAKQEVLRLASLVGLAPSDLAKYPKELSGGMKQRMAFARALVLKPRILLLDEPFSSLDLDSREALQDVVLRVRSEMDASILCVSHDPEEMLYLADRVLVFGGEPTTILEQVYPRLPCPRSEEVRYSTEFQVAKRQLRAWLDVATPTSITDAPRMETLHDCK